MATRCHHQESVLVPEISTEADVDRFNDGNESNQFIQEGGISVARLDYILRRLTRRKHCWCNAA